MVKAIVIPASDLLSPEVAEIERFEQYQEIVGGLVQALTVGDVIFLCNEEGKIEQMPINTTATAYLYTIAPEYQGHDFLVGPVILVGDGGDDFTSVPSSVLSDFLLD